MKGRFPPEILNRAIEEFWASATDRINQLSDSEFEGFKDGLSRLFAESFKSIDEEAEYLWCGISDQRRNFDLYLKDAKLARNLTKEVRVNEARSDRSLMLRTCL